MNTARNENGKYTDLMLVQALFRTFSLQWMVVIQILTDFEKTRGVVTEGNDPAYSYLSEVTAKDLGVSTGVANLTLDHLVPPVTISLEFKPGKPWPPPIKTALTLNEVTEVSTGNGETAQIIPDDPSDPSLEVLVTFKGYSTKMHASEEARLKWWDETLRILSQPEYTGWQILWGPTAKREAIIEEAEAADLLPENKNKTPRSRVFIPLDKAEALTPENIAIEKGITPSGYFRTPTNAHSQQSIYGLFVNKSSSSTVETVFINTGKIDGQLREKMKEIRSMIICDHPDFKAYIELEAPLFKTTPQWNEAELPNYVDKAYGVQGIKILGSVLMSLDEQFAYEDGKADLDLVKIMEGAGYKKGANGAYKTTERVDVIKILDLILACKYTLLEKTEDEIKWTRYPLFLTLSEEGQTTIKRSTRLPIKDPSTNETHYEDRFVPERLNRKIQANPVWYTDSFFPKNGFSPQYSIVPKVLYTLDVKHGIAIRIGHSLAPEWRNNPGESCLKRSVKTLLERAKLPLSGKHAARDRARLFKGLDFMKAQGIISNYERKPSKEGQPLSEIISLFPPEQTKERNLKIANKKFSLLRIEKPKPPKALLAHELSSLIEKSGLSANKFAQAIGVDAGNISKMKKGEKTISLTISQKIREAFPSLRT
jgi:hypothetical protein